MNRRRMVGPSLLSSMLLLFAGCTESGSDSAPAPVDQWTTLGQNWASTYTNPGEQTLSTTSVGQLELDWHFVPRGPVNGAAAVVDGVVYLLSGASLSALDPATRTVLWENQDVTGSSSPTYDDGRLFVQTARGEVVSLDAATGTEYWRADVDPHPLSVGFSTPLVFERFVIVGSSSIEETAAANNATFTGSMVAFDRENGEELWRFYTATLPINGASIWSSPSLDPELRLVYGSTGNNYTEIAGPTSDSLFALEVDTGVLRWLTQLTEGDVFTIPNQQSDDTDFGTNPILYEAIVDGVHRKMVAAGQKSGVFWALDRETGEVVWSTAVSPGSALIGGFLNNGAFDGERILAAGSNGTSTAPGSEEPPPGSRRRSRLVALDPATGGVIWERQVPGWVWAPITSANGVGYVAVDDTVQAFNTRTGEKLYSYKTNGTISCAPVVAEGRLHFGSGLAYFLTTPGRDFFVLSLDGRGGDDGPGPGDGTTFTEIYEDIIVGQGCTTSSCHGSNQGNLLMATRDDAYANLVSVPAAGQLCGGVDVNRVEPGDSESSLLYDKLTTLTPTCGGPMPPSGLLDEESIGRIRTWIENGAPDD